MRAICTEKRKRDEKKGKEEGGRREKKERKNKEEPGRALSHIFDGSLDTRVFHPSLSTPSRRFLSASFPLCFASSEACMKIMRIAYGRDFDIPIKPSPVTAPI
jgi:hypothetical protein